MISLRSALSRVPPLTTSERIGVLVLLGHRTPRDLSLMEWRRMVRETGISLFRLRVALGVRFVTGRRRVGSGKPVPTMAMPGEQGYR